MSKQEILDRFGELLISQVRDEAIEKFDSIKDGKIKSVTAQSITKKLDSFDDGNVKIIRDVVLASIDDVVHNFLWMLEQNHEQLKVLIKEQDEVFHNILDGTDGLSGELYSEDGWIYRFSRYKENY